MTGIDIDVAGVESIAAEFTAWLNDEDAEPGQVFIYWTGSLVGIAEERIGKEITPRAKAARALGKQVRRAANFGKVALFQRRAKKDRKSFEYLAVRISPDTAQRLWRINEQVAA